MCVRVGLKGQLGRTRRNEKFLGAAERPLHWKQRLMYNFCPHSSGHIHLDFCETDAANQLGRSKVKPAAFHLLLAGFYPFYELYGNCIINRAALTTRNKNKVAAFINIPGGQFDNPGRMKCRWASCFPELRGIVF